MSKIMKSYQGVQLSRKYMQTQISAVKLPTDGLNMNMKEKFKLD